MTKVNASEMRAVEGGYWIYETARCMCGKTYKIGYNIPFRFIESMYRYRARVQAKDRALACANSHF